MAIWLRLLLLSSALAIMAVGAYGSFWVHNVPGAAAPLVLGAGLAWNATRGGVSRRIAMAGGAGCLLIAVLVGLGGLNDPSRLPATAVLAVGSLIMLLVSFTLPKDTGRAA